MFENIIGQSETIRTLSSELATGRFPRAALFFGPPYGGKLSTALETARVLTCRKGGDEWACECPSCRLQKELSHPHTMLLGFRYSEVEIAASADAFRRLPKPSTRYLFLRAVRKLVRRFDPVVWDAEESRMKGVQEKAAAIEELLERLPPAVEQPIADSLGRILEKIIEACAELSAAVRNDHITVALVRKLSTWARLTTNDSLKVAIIENVDRMQESARNALLKLLEEPPEGVRLILLSTHRRAIIPTVLSRLRPYPFLQRSPAEESEVLVKIFRDESGRYASLRSFFLAWKEINSEELGRLCKRFLELATDTHGAEPDILKELGTLFSGTNQRDREALMSFLEELTLYMQCALRQSRMGIDVLEEWNGALREAQSRIDVFNMSPQAVLESLFLRMLM